MTLGPLFEQFWFKDHQTMSLTKFKHLSQVVLKKIFEYYSMYSYGSNVGLPVAVLSWTLGTSFEQTWFRITRQCCIPYFTHLSLEKNFF